MSATLRTIAKSTLGLVLGAGLLLQGQVAYAQSVPSAQISGPVRGITLPEDDTTPTTTPAVPADPSDDPASEPVDPATPTEEPAPTEEPDPTPTPTETPVPDPTETPVPTAPVTPTPDAVKEPVAPQEEKPFLPPEDPNLMGNVEVPWALASARSASGLPSAGFNAGYIISNANMYDGSSMTATQIQAFLNTQVPRCTIGDPGREAGAPWGSTKIASKCLKNMKAKTQNRPANAYCKAYTGSSSESAAQIIAKVGRACGISPKVLLVRLQLEQSLVMDTWPTVRQFSFAMGWNCPDSGPGNSANCNNGAAGFLDQVYGSAWQVKRYKALPNEYRYKAKQTNTIQWHPNPGCGTSNVYIANAATAALYIYTPYRPNQAALNAGWSAAADGCATYGNRNFYQYYRAWFGAPNSFFSDVEQNHKYFTEIEWMGKSGISKGTAKVSGTVFQPNAGTTRRAMAAFLYRMNGSPKVTLPKASPFSDVKPGDSFYKEIVWMHQQGMANGFKKAGSKPEYRPMTRTTRGAMAAFIFRMTPGTSSYQAPASSRFGDISRSHPFYREISWMRDAKLSSGYADASGKRVYKSGQTVTRQAMAAFLYRLEH